MIASQRKDIKIIALHVVILMSIISIFLGVCFIFLTTYFPKLGNNDLFTDLMLFVFASSFGIATLYWIPFTVTIKMEIDRLIFIIIIIIFCLISSVFAYYFLHDKPILFDLIDRKFTFSFFLTILFLCFSIGFVILSNTLFLGWGKYLIKMIHKPIIRKWSSSCLFLENVYSRSIFSIACLNLYLSLLMVFKGFLLDKL